MLEQADKRSLEAQLESQRTIANLLTEAKTDLEDKVDRMHRDSEALKTRINELDANVCVV
jgi:predicted nuclease with TOPRIM domain